MRGTGQTGLQRAIGATAWLVLACAASSCTGPGLEPPGHPNENGGGGFHGGTGGGTPDAGLGGEPSVDPPGDGDGDSAGRDGGEAMMDASVDEDGGIDPQEVEP